MADDISKDLRTALKGKVSRPADWLIPRLHTREGINIVVEYLTAVSQQDIGVHKCRIMDTTKSNRLEQYNDLLRCPRNPFPAPPGIDVGKVFRGDVNDQEGLRLATSFYHEAKFHEYSVVKSVLSNLFECIVT